MSSLSYWTMVIVLYQTTFSIIMSWLILGCKLSPSEAELHEVTLMKLLYLHDPEACGRVYFYNYTHSHPVATSKILWPVKNDVAAGFRKKIRVWLSLHIIWAVLGAAYFTQGQRPCGLYATLLPFTLTGVAMAIMDVCYTAMFLSDAVSTGTEAAILDFINTDEAVRSVYKTPQQLAQAVPLPAPDAGEDSSWIALLLAFVSCRAVVQWVINFWLVKDNYCNGLEYYRHLSRTRSQLRKQYRGKMSF